MWRTSSKPAQPSLKDRKARMEQFLRRTGRDTLSLATPDEYEACLDLWVNAFAAEPPHPQFLWIVKDDTLAPEEQTRRLRLQLRFMMKFVTRRLVSLGLTLCVRNADGRITAAAVLAPPGRPINNFTPGNLLACGFPPSTSNRKTWGRMPERKLKSLDVVDKAKAELKKEVGPAWFLQNIGVSRRGSGEGSLLMGVLCAFMNETGDLMYFECATPRLERFYQRFGCVTEKYVELRVDGCEETVPQYVMLRRPAGEGRRTAPV